MKKINQQLTKKTLKIQQAIKTRKHRFYFLSNENNDAALLPPVVFGETYIIDVDLGICAAELFMKVLTERGGAAFVCEGVNIGCPEDLSELRGMLP